MDIHIDQHRGRSRSDQASACSRPTHQPALGVTIEAIEQAEADTLGAFSIDDVLATVHHTSRLILAAVAGVAT